MSESCPFCQTQINDDAIVCTGCGASKTYRGRAFSLFFPLFFIIPGGLAFAAGKEQGLVLIAFGILILGRSYKGARDIVWRR